MVRLQIGCFFTVLFMAIIYFSVKRVKTYAHILFSFSLVITTIYLTFDITTVYTVNHLDTVEPWVNRVCHLCYLGSMMSVLFLLVLYTITIVYEEDELTKKLTRKCYLPFALVLVLLCFLPIDYKQTPNGNYAIGAAANLTYFILATCLLVTGIVLATQWSRIKRHKRHYVLLAYGIECGVSIYQIIFPTSLIASLGLTLINLAFFLTVESPDVHMIENLRIEKEKATAANAAKSDFLAKMSHEIRTPINSVLGMDEMILRENKQPDIKQYALDIRSSANALLGIINDILDSSKLESGKMEIIPVRYDLASLLNDLYNMMIVKANEKGLKLVFQINAELPSSYEGDDIRIRQVLMNLLSNGIKYTKSGSVTLKVDGSPCEAGYEMYYEVEDTGIGIRKEELHKLFEAFERIDEVKNRSIEGTGLGMNISMQLLEMMNSALLVESEYEKGSRFYFSLDQKVLDEEPIGDFHQRIKQVAEQHTYVPAFCAPEARILSVDDNEMNRKIVRGLLKETKVQVVDAASGKECLERTDHERYDLIFLDHMMPDMDGVETLMRMKDKTNSINAATPVIMLTANAVVGAKEQYVAAGFDDFLSKPIMPEKLENMLIKWLPEQLMVEVDNRSESDQIINKAAYMEEPELPQIEEFDFDYALGVLGSREMLMQMLEDFYYSLDTEMDYLQICMASITEEKSLNEYRIRVHGLKSTSAAVGALLLSKLARMLEVAAIEKDMKRISTLQPILIEEMAKHKHRLEVLINDKDELRKVENPNHIPGMLAMLKERLSEEDYDVADYLMKELGTYEQPMKIQELMERLRDQVLQMETEEAVDIIEEMLHMLQGGCWYEKSSISG